MKFKTIRLLKNKVFSTSINRVIDPEDPNTATEKQLEDDFGLVEIDAGGKFEAYVSKVAGAKPAFNLIASTPVVAGEFLFKFALNPAKTPLTDIVKISYSCDAEKETGRRDTLNTVISPLEIAQLKCEIFEKVTKDKIEEAIEAWKAQTTTFEEEVIPVFEAPLT